jgi:ParB-like chromosome segregation protein Spo0J
VQTNGAAVGPAQVDSGLVKLIARARGWWSELSDGELDVTALATREGLTTSYVSRVARLAFLAPEIVEAIARGQQPAALTSGVLTTPGAMPGAWPEQRNRYLGQS